MVHFKYPGINGYDFQICVFLSLTIVLALANIGDPGEMPHNLAFYLGLHVFLEVTKLAKIR